MSWDYTPTPLNLQRPRPKPPLERVVQRQIVAYLKAAGWSVWQTSQGHKHPTGAKGLRITPGVPDLYALHRRYGALWIECKREGEKRTAAQRDFAGAHSTAGVSFAAVPPIVLAYSVSGLRVTLKAMGLSSEGYHLPPAALLATAPTV